MRALVQRVCQASVTIDAIETSRIGHGLLVFLGIEHADDISDAGWLAGKIANLRVFADPHGAMNLGIGEVGGEFLVVSQFTLHASTRKGNRPSFRSVRAYASTAPTDSWSSTRKLFSAKGRWKCFSVRGAPRNMNR